MKKQLFFLFIFQIYSSFIFSQSFQIAITASVASSQIVVKRNGDIGISLGTEYLMLDSTGAKKWVSRSNGQYFIESSQETNDGGVILCGWSRDLNPTLESFVLIKKDSTGNTLWSKVLNDTSINFLSSAGSISVNNGIVLIGASCICNVDSTGNLIWSKKVETPYIFRGIKTKDEELIFIGSQTISKMDMNGNFLWTKSIPLSTSFYFIQAEETPNGFYSFLLSSSNRDTIAILITDTSGTIINQKIYSTSLNDFDPFDMKYISDSTLVVFGGTMEGINSVCQYAFLHIDANLQPIQASYLSISHHCNDPFSLSATSNGFVAVGSETFDDDFHILKISDPDNIDCSTPFNFSSDTYSFNLYPDTNPTTSSIFTITPFSDFSTPVSNPFRYYCGTTDVSIMTAMNISVFPNPFDEVVRVTGIFNNKTEINIFNIMGKKIDPKILYSDNGCYLNFKNVTPGVYFIRIFSDEFQFSSKLIKN